MRGAIGATIGLVSCVFGLYGLLIGSCLFVAAKCFEYSLWSVFGKDVPWYLDVLGGVALNGVNVPLAIGCAIARACGVEIPFYVGG